MRRIGLIAMFLLSGCGAPQGEDGNPLTGCTGGDVPIYSSRFAPQSGGSGVATPEDALAGKTNSEASVSTPGGAVESGASGGGGTTLSAMVATCGSAACGAGKVAVQSPAAAAGAAGTGDPAVGAPVTTSGVARTTETTPAGVSDTTPIGTPSPSGTAPASMAGYVCADPPPSCPTGQSPQFTTRGTWECTDCAFVVTYGGIYGNYRRCVSTPKLDCPSGEVPTWVYEDDQWECQSECDNGQYDQHTINDIVVCIPC